jgi:hypothetical protein
MTARQAPPIPRRIKVGDKTYSVDIIQSMQHARVRGQIWYEAGRIQIGQTSKTTGRKYSDIQMSETFWHELVHAILYEMDNQLYSNEKFVHEFATHLAKAIQSAKFK